MDETHGWRVIDEQRTALADLLDELTPGESTTPSLCAGWNVSEVAAHLTIAVLMTKREIFKATFRARGNFDRMIHETAVSRAAARSTTQIVADLRSTVGSRRLAPTTKWRDPLFDILVHTQDIARPLGREVAMPTDAALTALEWIWRRRFPYLPRRRFRGIRLVADDVDWAWGQGAEIRGPVASLLLLCSGRQAALADLSGPGVSLLSTSPSPAGPDRPADHPSTNPDLRR